MLPFNKFPGADTILGPEMKSTGEVMGLDKDFGLAFAKSQEAAGNKLPRSGRRLSAVRNSMRRNIIFMVKTGEPMGFRIYATEDLLQGAALDRRQRHPGAQTRRGQSTK